MPPAVPNDVAAAILAGGDGSRLGGTDKATLIVGGRTLLARALAAVETATSIVVVGPPRELPNGVLQTREEPPSGGPVAGLYAARDALPAPTPWLILLAVDMPHVDPTTIGRLLAAAPGHDGAVLTARDRRHLALVLSVEALDGVRPPVTHGQGLWRVLAPLDLAEVPALGSEADDIDTPDDVARAAQPPHHT